LHCKLGHAVQIEPGLRPQSPKKREFFKCPPETIGYFAPRMPKIGARRLVANSQKPAIGGPFCEYQGQFLLAPDCLAGAAGIEPRYGDFESRCSCLSERIYRTPFIRIHKPLETLEFREPYRIHGVERSGENRAIRRRMGGLCSLEVRNPNQKSQLILGSIANIFPQRTGGCSEAGGGRGTGIEPSPGTPS
jgi:hypothetical protein